MPLRSARLLFALSALAVPSLYGARAQAGNFEQKERAYALITDTARKLCEVVKAEGSARSVKASGQINAEVNGLLRRLVNLGVSTGASAATSQYQGVRQEDLAPALRDESECRQRVFNRLHDDMLGPSATAANPAPDQGRQSAPFARTPATIRSLQPVAAPGRGGWTQDPATGCHVWNFEPSPGETISWSGLCSDGKASGSGTVDARSPTQSMQVTGTMVAGRMVGDVDLLLGSGDRYRGGVGSDGRPFGKGVFTFSDGRQLAGQFNGSVTNISGNAVLTTAAFRYEGNLNAELQAHGYGTLTMNDRPPVTAMWSNGCGFINGQLVAFMGEPTGCARRR